VSSTGTGRDRIAWGSLGALACVVLLVAGGLAYGSFGSPTRDVLVTQMLINAVMVVGLQIYVGNTGVLSFGHMGFGAIAGYTFALFAVDPTQKVRVIPDAPFGMTDAHLGAGWAIVVAVVVTAVVGLVVGLGLARSGARSGAVAATIITLALLEVTHEVANSWDSLTAGRNGISFKVGETLDGRTWIYLTLVVAVVVAVVFGSSRPGRLAQAAREDDLAARAMGINPFWPQLAALLLSVTIVAVGASLRTWQLGTVAPNSFFFDFTLLTLVMLIVGGRNSVTGALIGVAVITVGNETTRYLAGPDVDVPGLGWLFREGLTDIFLGGSMLLFMIFRPKGLVEDWELGQWLRRRFQRQPTSAPEPASPVTAVGDVELVADSVGVVFGGFRALVDASLTASRDEIVGLIGPNGAGKTTLLNVITGLVSPTEGSYSLAGTSLAGQPTYAIARAGLARTFQNLRLFPALSVRENVEIVGVVAARHRADRPRPTADQLLLQAGLWEHRERRARELDYGNARRLELARAAALAPDFLLLDEPTSGMSDTESLTMIDQVRGMAALIGAGVVVIDHDLGFITGICDRITCLDQGEIIATGTPDEVRRNPDVISAYLGSQG
jgi:branched-chain amino acid transport system permease protein